MASPKLKAKSAVKSALLYAVLTLLALFFVFPFAFMINKSLMTAEAAHTTPIKFFPDVVSFEGYKNLFAGESSYLMYTWNTLKIVLFNVVAIPLSSSIVAYGFAKLDFFGKKTLFALMISTILLPSMVLQIPQYILFTRMGWEQSAYPMTLPNLLGGGAMNIFLVRQFMRSIPKDLDEAAKIDGASAFRRYALVTLPLCAPILIYLVVGTFSGYWSDFYGPLVYLRDKPQWTLAIGIFKEFVNEYTADKAPRGMAAGVFMSMFPAILFFVFQRKLIDGVMVTGIKG